VYGSSIQGRSQDGAKIEDFKYLSKGKNISSTYLISITSLPEDEQTSKHGGGGRYNAIWVQGKQIKKRNKKEKMSIKKRIYIYMRKEKYIWVCMI
jgi:hypothetical protein